MCTIKQLSIGATAVILVIVAVIEIGILEKTPKALYIWERPVKSPFETGIQQAETAIQAGHLASDRSNDNVTLSGKTPPESESLGETPPQLVVPTIAFLVPARSLTGWTIDNIPLLQVFLPSLLSTLSQDDFRNFNYVIYMGWDVGDPLYDYDDTIEKLYDIVGAMSEVQLRLFSFDDTKGKPVLVWNRLFEEAFRDGCHYFYQVNDDVRFITSGWTKQFVDSLRGNSRFPDLGVTGPKDVGSAIFTQSFVSRIHMHIFGYFYPPLFDNWYSDDWMTHVYDDIGAVFSIPSVLIKNENSQGTRYQIDHSGGQSLEVLLRNGKVSVSEFLHTHIPGPTIYSDPVHKITFRKHAQKPSHNPGDAAKPS